MGTPETDEASLLPFHVLKLFIPEVDPIHGSIRHSNACYLKMSRPLLPTNISFCDGLKELKPPNPATSRYGIA
jgi:hypothetical protein